MAATALCIRLLMDVLALLVAQVDHSHSAQTADAALPQVFPDRLQFFEYEKVSVSCEEFTGLTEWRVLRKLNNTIPTKFDNWTSSAPSCNITAIFKKHSGEYWCEDAEGHTSGAINIAVTDGSVILDIPVHPVVEGYNLTLHCREKGSQSKHNTDFLKNGVHLRSLYKGKALTIQNVSKSDEGLYSCTIPGVGESPESWLAVLQDNIDRYYEETHPLLSHLSHLRYLLALLWIGLPVALLLPRRVQSRNQATCTPQQ